MAINNFVAIFTQLRNFAIAFVGLVLLFKLTQKLLHFYRFSVLVNRLPGPRNSWLNPFSHLMMLISGRKGANVLTEFLQSITAFTKFYAPSSSLFRYWAFNIPIVVIFKADAAEAVLTSAANTTKSLQYYFLRPWLGDGLIVSNGLKWAHRRKTLQSAFHVNILESFHPVIVEQTAQLVDIIRRDHHEGHFVDVLPLMINVALDIVCETSMGVRLNVQRNPALEYACAVRRVSRNVVKRMVRPHHWNRLIYEHFSVSGRQNRRDLQTVHSFTKEVISRKRAEMAAAANEGKKEEEEVELQTKSGSKHRYAFLDLLLHLKEDTASGQNGWSDEALQEEVETLMVAGHESTAMTLTWTLLLLGNHPQVQRTVQEEVDQLFESEHLSEAENADTESLAHYLGKAVKGLKYLNAVIKESLRLFPPAPIIGRTAKTDIKVPGDHQIIPAGSSVLLFLYNIHRDEAVFEQAERFKPERFIEKSTSFLSHPFAFVPFSAGPRSCIGAKLAMTEVAMMLALLMRSFTVTAEKRFEEVGVIPEITLRPEGPVAIRFQSREREGEENLWRV